MTALVFFVRRCSFSIILTCVLGIAPALSQSDKMDSLQVLIQKLPDNAEKVTALHKLASLKKRAGDSTCVLYARKALTLASRLGDQKRMGEAYQLMGFYYKNRAPDSLVLVFFDSALYYFTIADEPLKRADIFHQKGVIAMQASDFENAHAAFDSAYPIFVELKDSLFMSYVLHNKGTAYGNQGLYSKALEYLFKALTLDEQMNDMGGIAADYNSLAIIFKRQGNLEKAITYSEKSLAINRNLKNAYSIGTDLISLGIFYKEDGRLDQAFQMQTRALEIFDSLAVQRGKNSAYHNIGVIYFEKGDLEKSLKHLQAAIAGNQLSKNNFSAINNGIMIARVYLKKNLLEKAVQNANAALDLAIEKEMIIEQHEATVLLSEIYEKMNALDMALAMTRKGIVLHDSLFNLQKSQQIQELEIQYETAKKENQIALLNNETSLKESELKRKALIQNVMLGGGAILLLIAYVIFRSYQSRQKQQRFLLDEKLKNERLEAVRLQELDEAKSRFFANIAHEFRTPLTLILGPAEQIMVETTDQKVSENAQLIRLNADKLLFQTNQLLDLSKLTSGMVKLHPVKTDFIAFAKGTVFAFESLAEEKDIDIDFHANVDKLEMDFDPDKASIILTNLLSNSFKFTAPFGQLKVLVLKQDISVAISVTDTGMGISSEQLPYIFDRFYQVDDSATRKTQGTGIGLALSKELVELHNGAVEVSSELGKGTTFTITLPLNQEDALAEILAEELKIIPVSTTQWIDVALKDKDLASSVYVKENNKDIGHTVLVTEDNEDVRKFIVDILADYYHVLEAENGLKGLEVALDQVPDLIVSDVMMPEMDGYDFCRQLKEDERTSHIPVVLLTAKAGMESKLEGLDTGADDYLAKSFNARELLARIRNLIAVRQKMQQKFGKTQDSSLFKEKENIFITKLKAIIEENIDKEAFGMDELGKLLAMSRTQVHRKLKALTNLSTSQFIRQFKMEKALLLLRSENHNVSEVAYMLGFSSPSYFSTCFNEQFGYPPSEISKTLSKG